MMHIYEHRTCHELCSFFCKIGRFRDASLGCGNQTLSIFLGWEEGNDMERTLCVYDRDYIVIGRK